MGRYGRKSTCRYCNRLEVKKWRIDNRDKYLEGRKRIWARHKDQINRERRETRDDHTRELQRAWRSRNLERARRIAREYRAKNRDKVRAWQRQWYAENKDWYPEWRAKNPAAVREANHRRRSATKDPSPETLARIAEILTEPCSYCDAAEGIEVDHIVPLSRGGKHIASNLAPACGFCNRSKNDKLLEEWVV